MKRGTETIAQKQMQLRKDLQAKAEEAKAETNLRFGPMPEGITTLTGYEDEWTQRIAWADQYLRKGRMATLGPILPAILQLKGKPYTLKNFFPFEPFFRTRVPLAALLKTGRQVSKSTSLAAQGIVFSNAIPFFSTLYVTPLYEQIRRFSHNYVKSFLDASPIARQFMGSKTINSVLQRSFKNGSSMHFSFAFLDAERTRGVPADKNAIDEIQNMQHEFLTIIHETLSGSPWGLKQYAGTPLSFDNTMERVWQDSSQAEWIIKCQHGGCNHWNTPCLSHDLTDMIGPVHDNISPKCPGVVCAKCRRPLDPRRHGRWFHAIKERRFSFAGYHVPQIIMPMHYETPEKWDSLVGKMQGRANTPLNVFFNEVCGESYDTGSKLVTITELRQACCLPWPNKVDEAEKHIKPYLHRIVAVDWGGGGGKLRSSQANKGGDTMRERTSFTVITVMGIRPDGRVDVLWGHRSLRTHAHDYEARLVVAAMARFKCSHVVHDYNGSGATRETIIRHAGVPLQNIIAIAYHPSGKKNIMNFHPASEDHPRDWYSVDKARSLTLVCQLIKTGDLRFYQYDHQSSDSPGLVHDFLALIEEKTASRLSSDIYVITKNPNMTDDFAQAVNIGACALFTLRGRWPDLADSIGFAIPPGMMQYLSPHQPDWDDMGGEWGNILS